MEIVGTSGSSDRMCRKDAFVSSTFCHKDSPNVSCSRTVTPADSGGDDADGRCPRAEWLSDAERCLSMRTLVSFWGH